MTTKRATAAKINAEAVETPAIQPNSDIADKATETAAKALELNIPAIAVGPAVGNSDILAQMLAMAAKPDKVREGDMVGELDKDGNLVATYRVARRATNLRNAVTGAMRPMPGNLTQIGQRAWTFQMAQSTIKHPYAGRA